MTYNYGSQLCLLHFVFAISLQLFLSEETATCFGVYCWIVSVRERNWTDWRLKCCTSFLYFTERPELMVKTSMIYTFIKKKK